MNRKQRRVYKSMNKDKISEAQGRLDSFKAQVTVRNWRRFVFMTTPSKSGIGFFGVKEYDNYTEYFSFHWLYRAYCFGKINEKTQK